MDAVIGDYIAGSVETEINIVEAEGADVIFVEGQGALTHQGYSSVTLGLMHGTMPDAMILVHQPTRERDDYGFRFPPLPVLVRLHEQVVGYFKPTKVVAIGLNSVGLSDGESMAAAARIERETGLPASRCISIRGRKTRHGCSRVFRITRGGGRVCVGATAATPQVPGHANCLWQLNRYCSW